MSPSRSLGAGLAGARPPPSAGWPEGLPAVAVLAVGLATARATVAAVALVAAAAGRLVVVLSTDVVPAAAAGAGVRVRSRLMPLPVRLLLAAQATKLLGAHLGLVARLRVERLAAVAETPDVVEAAAGVTDLHLHRAILLEARNRLTAVHDSFRIAVGVDVLVLRQDRAVLLLQDDDTHGRVDHFVAEGALGSVQDGVVRTDEGLDVLQPEGGAVGELPDGFLGEVVLAAVSVEVLLRLFRHERERGRAPLGLVALESASGLLRGGDDGQGGGGVLGHG